MTVHITFLSLPPHGRHDAENFWLEVEMDGVHFRVDFGKQEGSERNSIHINGRGTLEVNHHSINALDIYVAETNIPRSAQRLLVRSGDSMHGKCPCEQRELFFKIVLEEDFVGNSKAEFRVFQHLVQPAVQWSYCDACKCDVEAKALPGAGLYSLSRIPRREDLIRSKT